MSISNFLITSDYPLDKIIYITSGSTSVPNSTLDATPGITITHSLPFTPLPIMQWSNTSDFAITNELRDADYLANYFSTGAGQSYNCTANSSTIGITRYNLSGSTKTLYYRIFCFMPSDADADSEVPATASSGSNFILSTNYNYLKLVKDGILTDGGVESYAHNLGYVPRVQAWEETSGTVSRLIAAQDISGDVGTTGLHITDTELIWLNPSTYDKIHYRIYGDA